MMSQEEQQQQQQQSVDVDRKDDDESGKSLTMIRKLRFKIKLPDVQKQPMMNNDDDGKDAEEEYHCSLCGKGFRSRKALGGHMRVHAQQQQQRRKDVVDQLNTSSDMDDDDEANGVSKAIRCPICERDFPSNKALFGHMRCHPERSWRGIQPPPVYNSNSSSSTVSDVNQPLPDDDDDAIADDVNKQEIDLEKDLYGLRWGAKAIRGRDAINTKYSSSSGMMDVEVDGVQSLILLSQSGSGRKLENNQRLNHDDQLTLRPAVCGIPDIVNHMMTMNKKNLKFPGAELKSNHHVDHFGLEEISRGTKRKNHSHVEDRDQEQVMAGFMSTQHPNNKFKATDDAAKTDLSFMQMDQEANRKEMHKLRKYLKLNNHFKGIMSSSTTADHHHHSQVAAIKIVDQVQRYKCTTCNKSFSSHQALGGHKSSHNKLRNSNSTTPTAASGMTSNADHIQHPSDSPHPENYNITTQAQRQGGEAGSSHGDQGILTMSTSGAIPPLHQCNVCFKIYPSGQSLGGHKRLHCTTAATSLISKTPPHLPLPPRSVHSSFVITEPVVAAVAELPSHAPTVLPLAPAAVSSPDNKGVIRGFDLNEPPPLEDNVR